MLITRVCRCGHADWEHQYPDWPDIGSSFECVFCTCHSFKMDNLRSLERASEEVV